MRPKSPMTVHSRHGPYTIYKKEYVGYKPDYLVIKEIVLKNDPYDHTRHYTLRECMDTIEKDQEKSTD